MDGTRYGEQVDAIVLARRVHAPRANKASRAARPAAMSTTTVMDVSRPAASRVRHLASARTHIWRRRECEIGKECATNHTGRRRHLTPPAASAVFLCPAFLHCELLHYACVPNTCMFGCLFLCCGATYLHASRARKRRERGPNSASRASPRVNPEPWRSSSQRQHCFPRRWRAWHLQNSELNV